jgi:putative addiction module antidote
VRGLYSVEAEPFEGKSGFWDKFRDRVQAWAVLRLMQKELDFVGLSRNNIRNNTEKPMVELKVRRFGNSLGVVLPKEVVNRLQTGDGEALFLIEAPDGTYRLTPYDPTFEKKMEKAEDIISRYRNTLNKLAK